MLLAATPTVESENSVGTSCKRKKSFSDPGDASNSQSNQYDSFGEDSSSSSGTVSKLLLDRYDDQLLNTRFILNKSTRRELRRQQRLASGRMCDICQQRMLPGKDVATLLNVNTGKLACSSRNVNGTDLELSKALSKTKLAMRYEPVPGEPPLPRPLGFGRPPPLDFGMPPPPPSGNHRPPPPGPPPPDFPHPLPPGPPPPQHPHPPPPQGPPPPPPPGYQDYFYPRPPPPSTLPPPYHLPPREGDDCLACIRGCLAASCCCFLLGTCCFD